MKAVRGRLSSLLGVVVFFGLRDLGPLGRGGGEDKNDT